MLVTRLGSWLTALALLAPLADQDGVLLRWKWHAGDVLRYRMTMEASSESSMFPDMGMENTCAMVLRQEVKDVASDGSASIEFGYEAVRMEMNVGGETHSFDSTLTGDDAKSNDDELASLCGPMLEAKLHMTQAPNGRVSEISGAKELITKLMESANSDAPLQFLEGMFSDDSLRKLVEVSVFPEAAVKPGDTWKREHEQAMPPLGTMKFVVDSQLANQETHGGALCARIAMNTSISLTADEDSQFRIRLDPDASRAKGTLWFDVEHGRMVEVTQVMEMKLAFGGEGEEDAEAGHSMEIATTTSMTMLLLAKDAPAFERGAKAPEAK